MRRHVPYLLAAMRHKDEEALNTNAEQRLRELLHRQPTAKEISQLRLGEQALGMGSLAFDNARQLVAETRALRKLQQELVAEVREKRGQARRLRQAAAKKRGLRRKG